VRVAIYGTLGVRQYLAGLDSDCAADRDELSDVEQPKAALVGDYKLLGQSEACCEFCLRQAGLLASFDQKSNRGLVEIWTERRHDR
jgi:hypothetical protein